jgi:hypothetical protein
MAPIIAVVASIDGKKQHCVGAWLALHIGGCIAMVMVVVLVFWCWCVGVGVGVGVGRWHLALRWCCFAALRLLQRTPFRVRRW